MNTVGYALTIIALMASLFENPLEVLNKHYVTMTHVFCNMYLQLFFTWHEFQPSYHPDHRCWVRFSFSMPLRALY